MFSVSLLATERDAAKSAALYSVLVLKLVAARLAKNAPYTVDVVRC